MATVRKRSSGFSTSAENTEEEVSIEELLDESAREMFETISREEEEAETKNEAVEPKPFVHTEITPTEDVGPRFVEKVAAPVPTVPQLQPKPKRHPRNVPKFSRHK